MSQRMKRAPTRSIGAGLCVTASLWLSACGSAPVPEPVALSGAHVDEVSPRASIDEFLPWAEEQGQMIIVDKTARKLVLYRHGEAVKTYAVVLGRVTGRKAVEGDRRTPSGVYRITSKRVHPKYDRFLAISYPKDGAVEQYHTPRGAALTRAVLGQAAGRRLGGQIGIHGSDNEQLNRLGINWTFGCVSLANRDIEELYQEVDEGTPVLIFDDQQP
jgi:murein L,D-transpeptidase YafK